MKDRKYQKKIAKGLTKVQTAIGMKHNACCVHTVCLNMYCQPGPDKFGLELNHNLDNTEQMVELMAIAMIKECEKQGKMELLDTVWKRVMSNERECETGTKLLQ